MRHHHPFALAVLWLFVFSTSASMVGEADAASIGSVGTPCSVETGLSTDICEIIAQEIQVHGLDSVAHCWNGRTPVPSPSSYDFLSSDACLEQELSVSQIDQQAALEGLGKLDLTSTCLQSDRSDSSCQAAALWEGVGAGLGSIVALNSNIFFEECAAPSSGATRSTLEFSTNCEELVHDARNCATLVMHGGATWEGASLEYDDRRKGTAHPCELAKILLRSVVEEALYVVNYAIGAIQSCIGGGEVGAGQLAEIDLALCSAAWEQRTVPYAVPCNIRDQDADRFPVLDLCRASLTVNPRSLIFTGSSSDAWSPSDSQPPHLGSFGDPDDHDDSVPSPKVNDFGIGVDTSCTDGTVSITSNTEIIFWGQILTKPTTFSQPCPLPFTTPSYAYAASPGPDGDGDGVPRELSVSYRTTTIEADGSLTHDVGETKSLAIDPDDSDPCNPKGDMACSLEGMGGVVLYCVSLVASSQEGSCIEFVCAVVPDQTVCDELRHYLAPEACVTSSPDWGTTKQEFEFNASCSEYPRVNPTPSFDRKLQYAFSFEPSLQYDGYSSDPHRLHTFSDMPYSEAATTTVRVRSERGYVDEDAADVFIEMACFEFSQDRDKGWVNPDCAVPTSFQSISSMTIFWGDGAITTCNNLCYEEHRYPVTCQNLNIKVRVSDTGGSTNTYTETHFIGQGSTVVDQDNDGLHECGEYTHNSLDSSGDTDGDSLSDYHESNFYSGRYSVFCSICNPHDWERLPDPSTPDVFVEVDYMEMDDGTDPIWPASTSDWDEMTTQFAAAPIFSPTGGQGVRLHLDMGEKYPNTMYDLGGGEAYAGQPVFHTEDCSYEWKDEEMDRLAAQRMSANRMNVYRYAYWVFDFYDSDQCDQIGGKAQIGGQFFIMANIGSLATLSHELGHALSLRHGGLPEGEPTANLNYKPNHISVMNYAYSSGVMDNRESGPYYGYLREDEDLDEAALDEQHGLGPLYYPYSLYYYCTDTNLQVTRVIGDAAGPIDWDCDGSYSSSTVYADVDGSGAKCAAADQAGCDFHLVENEWLRLQYQVDATINPSFGNPDAAPAIESAGYSYTNVEDEDPLGTVTFIDDNGKAQRIPAFVERE